MTKFSTCTVGADPEFFVRRTGHIIPAHDFGCGTKQSPASTPHGSVQVDGLALEANVTPTAVREEFIQNVKGVMTDLEAIIKAKDKHYSLAAVPYHDFGIKKMNTLPPEARQLGCEPDYDAYTGAENPKPAETVSFRTGAGHIHVGWTNTAFPRGLAHVAKCRRLIKQLDFYVGLVTLLFDHDQRRRQLYGKAGAYRVKPYGVEYRTPSNKWTQTAAMTGLMFDQTVKAFQSTATGHYLSDDKKYAGVAQMCINSGFTHWPKLYPELYKEVLM